MIGIMNDVIKTATRRSDKDKRPDRVTRIRNERRVNRDSHDEAFDRNLTHPRGYW